ncbi:unnamed protein product [Pylaiella littoralis]
MFAVVLPFLPAEVKAEPRVPPVPSSRGERASAANATPAATAATSFAFGDIGDRNLVFLVADDHVINTKLLQRKIATFSKGSDGSGHRVEVLTAADGLLTLDALTTLRSTQPNGDGAVLAGIFVDFHMPNLDGVECTRRIRLLEAENGWPRTTIYGCTANSADAVRDTFLDAGGDGLVSKL